MKLQALNEAKYHLDPDEQFLNRFFDKEDEDEDHAWYSPKDDIIVLIDNPFGGELDKLMVSHVISYNPGEGKTEYAIFPQGGRSHGGGDPLGDGSLQGLEVYEKVA